MKPLSPFLFILICCSLSLFSYAQENENCDDSGCSVNVLELTTGYDHNSGGLYPDPNDNQVQDAFWTLVDAPPFPVVNPGPVWTITPNGAWSDDFDDVARWVSPFSVSSQVFNNREPSPPYSFERCFCVCEDTELTFDFTVLADDQVVDIWIDNDRLIPTPFYDPTSPGNRDHFEDGINVNETISITQGQHCIRIDIRNIYSVAMGMLVSGEVTGANLLSSACCDDSGSICGYKFEDKNFNGIWDAGEPPLQGWTINITGDNISPQSITTDTLGRYCFDDLPPGTYTVSESQQSNWIQTFPDFPGIHTVSVGVNEVISNVNFGNFNVLEECNLAVSQECTSIGCSVFSVSGADTYRWLPSINVTNPNSSNPTICGNQGDTYVVMGYVDGQLCGVEVVELDSCTVEEPPVECDGFYAVASCATCGCGELTGRVTVYDSNGNVADPNTIDITWSLNGQPYQSNSTNPLIYHYDGPKVFTAHIRYLLPDGTLCETSVSAEVVCEDDCPSFQIATCNDEIIQQNYPEYCERDELCSGEGGYLFILDGAGNLIDDRFYIDWFDNNSTDTNPYFLDGSYIYSNGCEAIPVSIFSFSGCEEVLYYEPDCCSQSPPEIACYGEGGLEGQQIWWDKNCGNEFYEVEVYCLNLENYGYTETFTVTIPDYGTQIVFTIPPIECNDYAVRVRGFCSSTESYGEWSDCLIVYEYGCYDGGEECDYIFEDYDGGYRNTGLDSNNSTSNLAKATMQLYPNPSSESTVVLILSEQMVAQYEQVVLKVQDINGKIIAEQQLKVDDSKKSIDLLDTPSGIYFVSIHNTQGAFIESKPLLIHKNK